MRVTSWRRVVLLPQVQRYMRLTRTSPSRFGRDAAGDPNFVFDLYHGREPRDRMRKRILDYLQSHQPPPDEWEREPWKR